MNDSYPEPYLIAPPFTAADIRDCKACPAGAKRGCFCNSGPGPGAPSGPLGRTIPYLYIAGMHSRIPIIPYRPMHICIYMHPYSLPVEFVWDPMEVTLYKLPSSAALADRGGLSENCTGLAQIV